MCEYCHPPPWSRAQAAAEAADFGICSTAPCVARARMLTNLSSCPALPSHCTLPCYSKAIRLQEGGRYRAAGHNEARILYHPRIFDVGDVVMDVGAFEGHDLNRMMKLRPPRIAVHAYEPVPAIREKLMANVASLDQVIVHPYGIDAVNRTSCFVGMGQDAHEQTNRPCRQPSLLVDIAWALSSFSRVKLLHINCEGCELQLLRRLIGLDALTKVSIIELQVHHKKFYSNGLNDVEVRLPACRS
jgi:FkbM family methyltransferase